MDNQVKKIVKEFEKLDKMGPFSQDTVTKRVAEKLNITQEEVERTLDIWYLFDKEEEND